MLWRIAKQVRYILVVFSQYVTDHDTDVSDIVR